MIDTYTRFAVVKVLKKKEMDEIVKNLEQAWFLVFGRPSTRLWSYNGKEFANKAMYAFARKCGVEIEFGPSYAPWSNGLNERNHALADKAVHCFLKDHPRAGLQEAVNTNTSKAGYIPMQLMFRTFPGFVAKDHDDEDIKSVDKHLDDMSEMRKEFMENEYKRRITIGKNQRLEQYHDET